MSEIDLSKVDADIASLSMEDLSAKLTKIRTREKVTQKKNYNSPAAKRYQAKARAEAKAMKEKAKSLPGTEMNPDTGKLFDSLWEQISFNAEVQAEAKLKEEAEESTSTED
jgi:hypothetical protein